MISVIMPTNCRSWHLQIANSHAAVAASFLLLSQFSLPLLLYPVSNTSHRCRCPATEPWKISFSLSSPANTITCANAHYPRTLRIKPLLSLPLQWTTSLHPYDLVVIFSSELMTNEVFDKHQCNCHRVWFWHTLNYMLCLYGL